MKNNGFTLLELILYIAIVTVVMMSVGYFVTNMSVNISDIQDTEEDGSELMFVVERLTREIQNADGIDLAKSVFDSASSKLALINPSGGREIINLSADGIINKIYSDGKIDELTGDDIEITSLIFSNASLPKRPGVIHIKIISSNLDLPFETAVSFRESIIPN